MYSAIRFLITMLNIKDVKPESRTCVTLHHINQRHTKDEQITKGTIQQIDRKTDKQTNRQTGKQANRHTDKQTDTHLFVFNEQRRATIEGNMC